MCYTEDDRDDQLDVLLSTARLDSATTNIDLTRSAAPASVISTWYVNTSYS